MVSPQVMMIHSDRPLDALRADLNAQFDFVPDHVYAVSGQRPSDTKSTRRFATRALIEAYCAGQRILIHNTDVPADVRGMSHLQLLVLIHNSWGYLNIPTELKHLDCMEALEVGTHDPTIGSVHYVVTRKPQAETA